MLDRPERGNSFDRAAVLELRAALAGLDESIELVVLRGAGGRAFCGGADAKEMVDLGPEDRRAAVGDFCDLAEELWNLPALTVAVLDGYATGGGAHLAMACDLRIAAPGAWIRFGSARYGLAITSVYLTVHAGPSVAASLLASARRVGAEEGQSLGLFQALTEEDEPLAALGLAGGGSGRLAKAAVRAALPAGVAEALAVERARAVAGAGLDAFVDSLRSEASARARTP
jgi:enoyl-CoA hydratase/carnithine racemase